MGPNPKKNRNEHVESHWSPIDAAGTGNKELLAANGGVTISSYSKIWRFPSYRNEWFHNAVEYAESKRRDEGIGLGLWRVHDKLYNLGSFARLHPGGQEWITMTNGTDITEAFETSHLLNRDSVTRVLAKYFVKDADCQRNSPFTFNENGFYRTLQKRVEPVLRAAGGPAPRRTLLVLQDALAITYFVLAFLSVYLDSFLLQFVAGIVLAWTIVCAHNFFHIRDNWRKYYFDLSFVSSYEWRLGHALSHHLYPNTVLDYEVYLMEPWTELGAAKSRNLWQGTLAHFYVYVLYSQFFAMELMKRIINVFFRRIQWPRTENWGVLVQLLLNIYLTNSVLGGVRAMFIIHSTASFYFSFVGTATASHHHPESFHEGDRVREETDFGLCQLDVVKESTEEYTHNMAIACVTFGEHPLHHLFPTVCHSKLHYLQSTVDMVLEEFREQIHALNSFQKYTGIHQQLNRQTVNNFQKKRE